MKARIAYFVIMSISVCSPNAFGHAIHKDFLAMSMQELMDVEITGATLTAQSLQSVPSSVTVFSYEQINRMGLDTLDELMSFVPGFQSYRSSTSPLDYPFSSRGRRIGTASAEILVLLDGQRLNDARSNGSAISIPSLSLKQIERVEFIRGAGSAVYGSNAMLGVINIISRQTANEAGLAYGSFDRSVGHVLASQNFDAGYWSLFGHFDTDQGDAFSVPDASGSSYVNTDDPRAFKELNVNVHWYSTHIGIQHNQYQAENFISFNGPGDGINYRLSKQSSISLSQYFDWGDVLSSVTLNYKSSSIEVISQASAEGALVSISNPSSTDPLITQTVSDNYTEAQFLQANDWRINRNSSVQFGVELRHLHVPELNTQYNYDLNAYINGDAPITWYGGSFGASRITQQASRRDIGGIYTQYQYAFQNSAELILGLRYDRFSDIGSQLSPRIGLVQPLTEHQSLKVLYGEAFRAPSEEELNLATNSSFAGNAELKPETVQTLEFIWLGQWNSASMSLGYFENQFNDAIVLEPTGNDNLQYTNLTDDERSSGVEFELTYEFHNQWLMRTSYTHFFDSISDAFREAESMASLMINYQWDQWNANMSMVQHGEREMLTPSGDFLDLDSFTQVYAKLQYQIDSQWDAYVQAKNLLDEGYMTPSSGTFLANGVPNRSREILFGIHWNF